MSDGRIIAASLSRWRRIFVIAMARHGRVHGARMVHSRRFPGAWLPKAGPKPCNVVNFDCRLSRSHLPID